MRRRFGRRRGGRSNGGAARGAPIDGERWLAKIIEDGVVAATRLEAVSVEGVPAEFAAVGQGEAQDGARLIVGFAPRSGGDAVLAALALATQAGQAAAPEAGEAAEGAEGAEGPGAPDAAQPPGGGFEGEVIAVAPQWSSAARRRLGLLGALPFRFRAIAASSLSEGDVSVEPEALEEPPSLRPEQVAGHLTRSEDRALFERAAAALEGLASKHGGAVRGVGRAVELVLLARRVAELRADDGGVVLNTILPTRSTVRLSAGDLAGALDRLEGNLRKRLNDRRTLEGDEGLRARVIPLLGSALGLRGLVPWPLGGSDQEALDLAGVDAEGLPVVGAVRGSFTLSDLAAVLDATATIQSALPHLLAPAGPPLRLEAPRLVIAARTFDAAATRLLPLLGMGFALVEVQSGRDGAPSVSVLESGGAAPRPRARPRRERRPRREAAPRAEEAEAAAEAEAAPEGAEAEAAEEGVGAGRGRGRRRGRGRGRGRGRSGDDGEERGRSDAASRGDEGDGEGEVERGPRFEEMSAFDLDDGGSDEDGEGQRRRGRRRRGRRGGTDRGEAATESEGGESSPEAASGEREGRRRGGRRGGRGQGQGRAAAAASESEDEEDDDAPEDLEELVTELPDFDVYEAPDYDDDEEEPEGDETDKEAAKLAEERERRRRARLAKTGPEKEPEPVEKPKPPRRRSAFVAHADRDSIMAAILLARDVRLIEGFWVYPQEELMTFFRSVATDLKEGAPIYVVGFQPKPARDVISTVGLYGDRVHWFDHQEWPPEDELALRQTIGEDNLQLAPRAGSSLPIVLSTSTRRSRFSDKLVDLATARFSQHDYERWGRLWWWRLGEMAANPGDRRRDIEPLLAGRPSDLAKEASRSDTPPPPREVEYVASRDFRLVHFGGFSLVVVEVPQDLDPYVCGRVARERYRARLSLVTTPGEERIIFAGEELGGKRSLDFGAVVEHLVSKLQWVEALPEDDHVARFRVRNLAGLPQRLDEVIAEIAMGRSILEG